ncbi:transposase [Sphingobium xanthum]|uniref:IS110 family transposase n=1 Tax=Sphingobium xanthum TaxID=1387165 RepID=UPI001C8B8EF5|nr:transposase [Sphingobium xanthum]
MMTKPSAKIHTTLGLDVSQDSVTLYDSLTRQTLTITNQRDTLIEALAPFADRDLALCEATGGHEDGLLAILHALAIPAHRADAAKVKAYIRSCGKRAKTDPIDARWLAQYGLDHAASSLPRPARPASQPSSPAATTPRTLLPKPPQRRKTQTPRPRRRHAQNHHYR